jgi:hypothetical protein
LIEGDFVKREVEEKCLISLVWWRGEIGKRDKMVHTFFLLYSKMRRNHARQVIFFHFPLLPLYLMNDFIT